LHENKTDVCCVDDLGPVGQRLRPELRGWVQHVAVAFGHRNLGAELLADQVFNFEGAVIGLENVFYFFAFSGTMIGV